MKCPICIDSVLSISERSGIEIDFCPDCRGIWLDRGELDKILEKSRQTPADFQSQNPPPQQPVPPYQQGAYNQQSYPQHQPQQQYQKPYKRKKSFLEELFD